MFHEPKRVATGSKWAKTMGFSKNEPGQFEVLKQVFLAHFERVWTKCSPFHHMYAPRWALHTYLGGVW